jgi:hypothetical protein
MIFTSRIEIKFRISGEWIEELWSGVEIRLGGIGEGKREEKHPWPLAKESLQLMDTFLPSPSNFDRYISLHFQPFTPQNVQHPIKFPNTHFLPLNTRWITSINPPTFFPRDRKRMEQQLPPAQLHEILHSSMRKVSFLREPAKWSRVDFNDEEQSGWTQIIVSKAMEIIAQPPITRR